ncbi:MarR family winged helix-turn-helix transcriptional regulator [Paucidesulfovibrio longus]|uniref:MarR family winged helix-turn-helix transcriptional regulator n=1 Tax=Paucidesulfovibrio longus TaxID=889 RepID=UPI001B7FE4D7|nr:MarR family transcriptional regulator [Paucidesulfovibrio longus]
MTAIESAMETGTEHCAETALGSCFQREKAPGYWTNQLSRRFMNRLARRLEPLGICAGQFGTLVWLWEKDQRTQAELCRCLGVDQSTMARTLTRMERDGLITRRADPSDRRSARILLTEKSRALEVEVLDAAHQVNKQAVRGLSAEEAELFFDLARRMIANLNTLTEDDR